MQYSALLLSAASVASAWPAQKPSTTVSIPNNAPAGAGVPLENFVSFSIEFSYFPDYAGNTSNPNTFSSNLLENIKTYSGSKPYIRVGGSSQDNALFVPTQTEGAILTFASATADQPSNLTYGPNFFQSYHTWPQTTFVHGLNLKYNTTAAHQALLDSIPYACASLRGQLLAWELGNEADLYAAFLGSAESRPASCNEAAYVSEWLNLTRSIRSALQTSCPDMAKNGSFEWYAPSFAASQGLSELDQVKTWNAGLDADQDLKVFASHHYQGVATNPGISLQGTLMNHTATIASVNYLANQSNSLHAQPSYPSDLPFILGEGNSLARQGAPGLSNSFGAALWGVDANLLMASKNIRRFHMHQGTNYRYQAWQPINTARVTKGTKAPYYGNVAVAAFLGDLTNAAKCPQVVNLPLSSDLQAAYASYINGQLSKIMLINLQDFNATAGNNYTSTSPRGSNTYSLQVPSSCNGKTASVQRLVANGSDAVTGVTFDGYSYNYELDNGKPVLLRNVTRGETLRAGWGGMSITVPDSSAALINFDGKSGGWAGW
ncbi:hypothetical protein LTR78_004198 [Recurvomyces mirabilis]|uniref:Beta-glucuronidase C-terminal domain-containing protein n=1 Tax=Recurvomyces mirabilis TaxID=574656 RepID=A0AAE0WQJ6_9PEZI|nr:hypothetical protein LTR78_004198 [Recurvomyces mirabilis]KAK5153632.1 hypothetical protein LTS14_007326 [Recurvomyces mirabilis]